MMIKKMFSTAILLFLYSAQLWAVPAKRVVKTVKQSDGTTLSIMLKGDESFHFFSTQDGYLLQQVGNGDFHYAQVVDTNFIASGVLAHETFQRNESEIDFLDQHATISKNQIKRMWSARSEKRNLSRAGQTRKMQQYANERLSKSKNIQAVKQNMPTIGQRKGLVILVEFSDREFITPNANTSFDGMMNKSGYKEHGQYGSVHDYFLDQSSGQFLLNFDVVGPVKLSKTLGFYGENNSWGDDKHPGAMVAEACKLVDGKVNFKDYDWDGDGEVEQIYIIYTGYGEASGGASNTIWPHQFALQHSDYGSPLFLDQVIINTYACSSELNGSYGSTISGIGTICHEFSHCLGLPDFYDTEGDSFGMNVWSLMDYGNYNDDGYTPAGYTSYEKMFCGWRQPIVLDSPCMISQMKALSEGGEAYITYNDANKNEYYLLENRQKTGWDSKIYGHGMLVIHVDYDKNVWYNNAVNTTSTRQRMTIIPADDSYSVTKTGLAGDPYPGTSNNYSLTDHTKPASILYTANSSGTKYLGKPIEDIAEKNGEISFTFMGGSKDVDALHEVSENTEMVDVYNLNGIYVGTSNYKQWSNGLQKGIYLLRQGDHYRKMILP